MLRKGLLMKRREFLKVTSGALAMLAAGNAGMLKANDLILTNGKRRIVFYFTATGNSLFVARQIGGETVGIPQALKNGNLTWEADEIGFVFPIYRSKAPQIVQKFIQQAKLKAPYMFSILTYGHGKCNSVELWDEVARKNNVGFDYITTISMVDNYLPAFDMNEEIKLDRQENKQIAAIKKDLEVQRKWHQPVTPEERKMREEFVWKNGELFPVDSEDILTVTDACIGCGLCTRVCPRKNLTITEGRAVNSGDCEFCLSCAHICPQKAIVLKKGEKNSRARYRHQDISVADIIAANNQL